MPLRQTYAHLLEDGMDIITLKDLLGHQNIELLPEPYFHVVLLYPIVLILWRCINPK
jgi:site-specific recombinase XerD